jgi:3-phytase
MVRTLQVSATETEGCVADDDLGFLYVADEANGIWKYGAEPGAGTSRVPVGTASASGPLVPDVEGLAIARHADGTGLLIASSQGSSTYAVYQREGANAFVGSFQLTAGNGIDGANHTDGIDVSTANFGPAFPTGLFVAQDGRNDAGNQNFKLVPYQMVAAAVAQPG